MTEICRLSILTSTPSGKIKGFPDVVDEQTFYRCLKAFHAPHAVNPAYARVIDVDSQAQRIIIRAPELLRSELNTLSTRFDNAWIEGTVTRNMVPTQRKNPLRVNSIIREMEENLTLTLEQFKEKFHRRDHYFTSYRQNFQEALTTFTRVRDEFDADESAYLKHALKHRRDTLIEFLRTKLNET